MSIDEMTDEQRATLRDDLEPLLGRALETTDADELADAIAQLGEAELAELCEVHNLDPEAFTDPEALEALDKLAEALEADDFNGMGKWLKRIDEHPVPASKPDRRKRARELLELEPEEGGQADGEEPEEGDDGDNPDDTEEAEEGDDVPCYLVQCNPQIPGLYRGDIVINPAPELEKKIRRGLPHTKCGLRQARKFASAGAGRINERHSREV